MSTKYELREARQSDHQEILEHLRKFYFRDLPLASYLNIVNDNNPICEEFEQSSMRNMAIPSQNIVAISGGKIVGVSLNKCILKNYREDITPKDYKNKQFAILDQFIAKFEKEADLFSKYPGFEKAFFIHNISVDNAYRGQGIAQALFLKSVELARRLGYGLLTINASSYFTARIVEKQDLDVIHSYKFEDYRINGEQVFRVPAPHKAITMFAKKLT